MPSNITLLTFSEIKRETTSSIKQDQNQFLIWWWNLGPEGFSVHKVTDVMPLMKTLQDSLCFPSPLLYPDMDILQTSVAATFAAPLYLPSCLSPLDSELLEGRGSVINLCNPSLQHYRDNQQMLSEFLLTGDRILGGHCFSQWFPSVPDKAAP